MLAELIESLPLRDDWKGLVGLATLFFVPWLAAIWFKPGVSKSLLVLLSIALACVADVFLSLAVVVSQDLDVDEFSPVIEAILSGIIALGWLVGAAVRGLAGRYGFLARRISSKAARVAVDVSRFARAHAAVAIRFSALVLLSECALLLAPYLALVSSLFGRFFIYVLIPLCWLGLPFGIPAFIARGRPLGAWTLAIAVNLVFLAWDAQFIPTPVPPGQTRALLDPERILFLLGYMPTLLATLPTATRWLWIGSQRLVERASG